jgi:hypothetical protein
VHTTTQPFALTHIRTHPCAQNPRAQLPQFLNNIKHQSSEALSIWFLAQWFAGDTFNLLGCLMQGEQLPTTTMLAM